MNTIKLPISPTNPGTHTVIIKVIWYVPMLNKYLKKERSKFT